MSYLIQQTINALGWGSVIGLLGAGYTMTFGIIGLVNFAHGEVMMVGGFFAFFLISLLNLPFWVGAIASLAGAILTGLLVERICFKPVREAGMITLFITSLGASIVIKNLAIIFFGDQLNPIEIPSFMQGVYLVGDLIFFKKTILILTITLIIGITLSLFVKKTKLGVAMRSISYDSQMSQTMGINTEKVIIFTFVISSALCGICGIYWSILFGAISSSMGTYAVVAAFITSVVGGIGNITGALVTGYILAIGGSLFAAFLPPELVGMKPLFLWIVFFAILLFKPSGLFRANIK